MVGKGLGDNSMHTDPPPFAIKLLQLLSLTQSPNKLALCLALQATLLLTAISVVHRSLKFCL